MKRISSVYVLAQTVTTKARVGGEEAEKGLIAGIWL